MEQILEPKLITEQEDVHLIEAFLIGTKPNEAGWAISKNATTPIQEWVGKDFVMIPEKIFDASQTQAGHTTGETIEEDWEEIKQHTHGKIVKVKGPYNYDDGSDDYYYNAVVKLKDTLSASTLIENGEKTWTPFAVSPQIIRHGSTRDNVTNYTPMGLFLVIKGAYGDQSVVNKMCSGSELKCGTKLSAAIYQLNHDTTDAHLAEVLTSYISATNNKDIMSAQTPELVQPVVQNFTKPELVQQPVNQPVELKKDENITLTKDEYDTVQKQLKEQEELRTEVANLKKERNQNILNQVFGSIEDQEVKNKIFEKYVNENVSLVKSVYDDINTHILPKAIEAKLAESKNDKEGKKESASILKPEPKIVKDETLSASIETDDLSISECRSILGL